MTEPRHLLPRDAIIIEPTVVYEPPEPRYIVQYRRDDPSEQWKQDRSYYSLSSAKKRANKLICKWEVCSARVIDAAEWRKQLNHLRSNQT